MFMKHVIIKLIKYNGITKKILCFMCVVILKISVPVYGQQNTRQINGVVNDTDGQPMPGVTILERGTKNGTTTNVFGQYTIKVPDSNEVILVFSFVGFSPQEIVIGDLTTININLSESSQAIEEVVVVGYGVQKKESLVASISQATEKELKRTGNVSDFRNALAGQIPGLVSISNSGEPGGTGYGESATEIFIRGKATWNNANPLVLVDGVERDLSHIDVSEVSSISVLKDAAATAVFGVKGANGVILVNTKRGAKGKMQFNASYTVTAQTLSKVPKVLDSYETLMEKNEIILRESALRPDLWDMNIVPYDIVRQYRSPDNPEWADIYPNVNWQDAMFKKWGFDHKANLNVQGGSKDIQFFGSLSYLHEGDMVKHYENSKGYNPSFAFDRLNFRANVDLNVTQTTLVKINFDGFYANKRQNYAGAGQMVGSGRPDTWRALYGMSPSVFPVQYADGLWGINMNVQNVPNPIASYYNIGVQNQRTTQLNTILQVEQNLKFITRGLSAVAMLSFNNKVSTLGGIRDGGSAPTGGNTPFRNVVLDYRSGPGAYTERILPESQGDYAWTLSPFSISQESALSTDGAWAQLPVDRQLLYQFQLNYSRKFSEKHNVSGLGLFQREELASGNDFKNYREDWVGRVTYDYDSRYLFEFNGAYNGSEQFGPGYRFAFFPSLAVGWYLSNENFFSGVEWVDKLKLRYSLGKVGNDRHNGGRWLYTSQYSYGGMVRLGDKINIANDNTSPESIYDLYVMSVTGNPDLCWETAVKHNYGLEFGLFQNLISVTFDYYNEERKGIMLEGKERSIPLMFGFPIPFGNAGHTKSNGYEVEVGVFKNIEQFSLWGKIFFARNNNKIVFKDDPPLKESYQKQEGYTVDQIRTQINTGSILQNWDEVYGATRFENNNNERMPGYYDIIDFNADGVIDAADKAPYGYSEVPQNSLNLTLGVNYKGWSFMIQFYGVNNCNREILYNNWRDDTDVLFSHASDYWSKYNTNANSHLPGYKLNTGYLGHFYVYDGSYLKLRSTELAYTFTNAEWIKKIGVSNMRLFLQGNDLFLWSRMPEARETASRSSGTLSGAYPMVKRIHLGFELSF